MLDIAVPRDVESSAGTLPGLTLLDLEDLRDWADRGRQARAGEAERVREIVAEEVDRYLDDASAREVAPNLGALHDRAEHVRQAEVARFQRRLSELEPKEREAVEALTRGLIAKLLRPPTVRLKEDAGTPRGERNAGALRDLFDLPCRGNPAHRHQGERPGPDPGGAGRRPAAGGAPRDGRRVRAGRDHRRPAY